MPMFLEVQQDHIVRWPHSFEPIMYLEVRLKSCNDVRKISKLRNLSWHDWISWRGGVDGRCGNWFGRTEWISRWFNVFDLHSMLRTFFPEKHGPDKAATRSFMFLLDLYSFSLYWSLYTSPSFSPCSLDKRDVRGLMRAVTQWQLWHRSSFTTHFCGWQSGP